MQRMVWISGAVFAAMTIGCSSEPEETGQDGQVAARRLDLNDVSILFPLPTTADEIGELTAVRPLLPDAVAAQFPRLTNEGSWEPHVRVVALRVDPCFPAVDGRCRRQLRLVAQPVVTLEDGSVDTRDGTMHLFYDLADADFDDMVARLRRLKGMAGTATDRVPLGIHPVLASEGLRGVFAVAVNDLVREATTRGTLTRLAVMQELASDEMWKFSAVDIDASTLTPVTIERTDATAQTFRIVFGAGEPVPEPSGSSLRDLLFASAIREASEPEYRTALEEVRDISNPLRMTVNDVDCVSCHIADRTQRRALTVRPLTIGMGYRSDEYDLRLVDDSAGLTAMRAFGYLHRQPSLTTRTVHESAEVAAALSVW